MIHDFIWFFTTGRFCPSWVQAVTGSASLFVSLLTLIALAWYVLDTHSLAESSAEQIRIMKKDRAAIERRNFQYALDTLYRVREELEIYMSLFVGGTYKGLKPSKLCPSNWADVVATLYALDLEVGKQALSAGNDLRAVDYATEAHYLEHDLNRNVQLGKDVGAAVEKAKKSCKELADLLAVKTSL